MSQTFSISVFVARNTGINANLLPVRESDKQRPKEAMFNWDMFQPMGPMGMLFESINGIQWMMASSSS